MNPVGFVPEVIAESPEVFHHRPVDVAQRALWVPALTDQRVLVLGSSQDDKQLDRQMLADQNILVAKRRSGGGAVLVSGDDLVWFDIVLPQNDPLWSNDVSRSFDWLGEAMMNALLALGVQTTVHRGPLIQTHWSRRVCFAGLGPGELTHDGRKLVGMSQRRTRNMARFQVAILRRWDGAGHRRLFHVPDDEAAASDRSLGAAATSIDRSPSEILLAVVKALAAY